MKTAIADTNPTESPPKANQIWRDEMNFCEYPLSVLGDRAPEDVTSLTYEISGTDGQEGKRSLTIIPASDEQLQAIVRAACPFLFGEDGAEPTARAGRRRGGAKEATKPRATADELRRAEKRRALLASVRGVPTANDDDVILALIELTRRKTGFRGDEGRHVPYSLYELGKLLGWNDSSRSYQRLVISLLRWKAVTLAYANSWRDNGQKVWVSKTFNILSDVTVYWGEVPRRRRGSVQRPLPFSSFSWDEAVYKSFQDGFLKNLDYAEYSSLRSMVAKRMYRFLDKHLTLQEKYFGRDGASFDLADFAQGHIGLRGDYEPWKIKQKLAAGIRELEEHRIIEPLPDDKRYVKQRPGRWNIVFRRGSVAPVGDAVPDAVDACPPAADGISVEERNAVAAALESRGLSKGSAQTFAREYSPQYLTEKMEHLDFLVAEGSSPKRPAGWLADAIRGDWKAPAGFETKEERARRQQGVEEKQRRQRETKEAARRREEQEIASRKAERRHIDGVFEGLTPPQRARLEEAALANADEKMREAAGAAGSMGDITRRLLVDREVLRQYPPPQPL